MKPIKVKLIPDRGRKPGVPTRAEMYRILKKRSIEIQTVPEQFRRETWAEY